MSEPLLSLTGVIAGYNGATVLRAVDLTVAEGEVVALLGSNGAGKTTILRVASGSLATTEGTVRFAGEAVKSGSTTQLARQGLAHVPEGRGIFFGLTVREHFRLGDSRTRGDIDLAYEYFPRLKEFEDRRAGLLSGGEQQMLALALALSRRPRLLLVDELSLGLAPVIVERLLPIVRKVADDTGCAVLLVEQHVELALDIADRGYVLSRGVIALDQPIEALRADRELLLASYLGNYDEQQLTH